MCIKILYYFSEFFKQLAHFLRLLICICLYCVHKDLINYAHMYMGLCLILPHLPILTRLICCCFCCFNFSLGINILNPYRCYNEQNIFSKTQLKLSALLTSYISLVGIIFLSLFFYSNVDCKESCDSLNRINNFFIFSICINLIAFIQSFCPLCGFKPFYHEFLEN